jgi:multicomponent Na+:H+ antiporter subunit F
VGTFSQGIDRMNNFFLIVTVLIAVFTAAGLFRVAVGKTVFDRVIAAGIIGTNGIILLVLVGFLFNRVDMIVDIAIAYALLNFVVVVVVGKYFETRKRNEP